MKTWKNGFENDYGRFDGYAWPPDKNGDYAFLLHMVKSLKSTGKGVGRPAARCALPRQRRGHHPHAS